jgi:hypothetical protein
MSTRDKAANITLRDAIDQLVRQQNETQAALRALCAIANRYGMDVSINDVTPPTAATATKSTPATATAPKPKGRKWTPEMRAAMSARIKQTWAKKKGKKKASPKK